MTSTTRRWGRTFMDKNVVSICGKTVLLNGICALSMQATSQRKILRYLLKQFMDDCLTGRRTVDFRWLHVRELERLLDTDLEIVQQTVRRLTRGLPGVVVMENNRARIHPHVCVKTMGGV